MNGFRLSGKSLRFRRTLTDPKHCRSARIFSPMETQKNLTSFLHQILETSSEKSTGDWLKTQAEKIHSESSPTKFFLAFSQASRYFKKLPINLSEDQKKQASDLVPGFDPSHWDLLQTARSFLLLQFPQEKEKWFAVVNQLFETGDMHEQQALYAALPIMPFPEELLPRAIDGCRTNMTVIFDAIALNNPFPATYFPEANWNQLVLKAVFMQRPLYRIQGLEGRRNLPLANIAADFAHERWAAGRPVMAEIWRLIVPFLNEKFLDDLKKAISSEDLLQIKATVLACTQSDYTPAKDLANSYPEIQQQIESGAVTWEEIGIEFQTSV